VLHSIPWVHHSREEGFLDYDGGFVHLQIHMNFDTKIYRQQAPFSGAVAGDKQSRSNLVSLIFQFSFWFSFASLMFDHPPKEKNQSNIVFD
jgi:hypothetical protein